ncbi:MAG TPA: hypothetical protein IAB56_03650 [Candidatus Scybalousia intestinigallinarum]|nr:hypothetical protein [Candidatus Scybalousia intestinigallinarum]
MKSQLEKKILEQINLLSESENYPVELDYLDEFFQDYSGIHKFSFFLSHSLDQLLLVIVALHKEKFPCIPLEDASMSEFPFLNNPHKYILKSFHTVFIMKQLNVFDDFICFLEKGKTNFVSFFKEMVGKVLSNLNGQVESAELSQFFPDFSLLITKHFECFIPICYFLENITVDEFSIFDPFLKLIGNSKEDDDKTPVALLQEVLDDFDQLYQQYIALERKWRVEVKQKRMMKNHYQNFLTRYSKLFKTKEITCFEELALLLPDDELRKEFLIEVFNHNDKDYTKLEQEYTRLNEHALSRYVELFSTYHYSFSDLTVELQKSVQDMPYDECKKRLSIISDFHLQSLEIVVTFLLHYDEGKLKNILSLLEKNILSVKNLNESYLLLCQDKEYMTLMTNIATIQKKGIRVDKFSSQLDVLFTDPTLLAENLKLLQDYGCRVNSRKVNDFSMLKEENLQDKLDSFLEVGLADLMISDPEILNADQNLVERILIFKVLGFSIIDSKTGKLQSVILNSKEFFVDQNRLSTYVQFIPVDLSTVDENELVDQSPFVYRYGEKLISKKRWERYQKQKVKTL